MSELGVPSDESLREPPPPDSGKRIGPYFVLERIGEGAMGVVYSAYDRPLRREVAVKVLNLRAGSGEDEILRRQKRLEWEAHAAAQLSHPNVVNIYAYGEEGDQAYLAMEFLAGGTLRQWMQTERRPWRQVVDLFKQVGSGLAATHEARFIHRDFKPDNVLLDKQGRPKVVDFGLVRAASRQGALASLELDADRSQRRLGPDLPATGQGISLDGSVVGTVSYMAPEQFRNGKVDERTDQFAFCVSLYEALYGSRPFEGRTQYELAANVIEGRVLEAPRGSVVPGWVRRLVLKGLSPKADDRFASVAELLEALERDPAALLRKRLVVLAIVSLIVAAASVLHYASERRRRELERRLVELEGESAAALEKARFGQARGLEARRAALAAFDAGRRDEGERAWSKVGASLASADAAFERAQQALRAGLDLDRERAGVRQRLIDTILDRAKLAHLQSRPGDEKKRLDDLAAVDLAGRERALWSRPGSLVLRGLDPAWRVTLQELARDPDWSWHARSGVWAPREGASSELSPGSYRLLVATPDERTYFLPFAIARGERTSLDLSPVALGAKIPHGLRLISGGRTFVGEADESLRVSFCNSVPWHEISVGSFVIAENETTIDEWIAFLDALPGPERAARRPLVATKQGYFELRPDGARGWTFAMTPTRKLYAARGAKIVYEGRDRLSEQEWRRFPVAGVSAEDAVAYAAWLASSKRVPGARLCTDAEWERAARGADGRTFPTGDRLGKTQANFDETYGRVPEAFGPDEVGKHAASASPFGVADLAGNVWEIVRPSFGPEPFVLRGGGYLHNDKSARSSNRESLDPTTRAAYVGVRICADLPRGESSP